MSAMLKSVVAMHYGQALEGKSSRISLLLSFHGELLLVSANHVRLQVFQGHPLLFYI